MKSDKEANKPIKEKERKGKERSKKGYRLSAHFQKNPPNYLVNV